MAPDLLHIRIKDHQTSLHSSFLHLFSSQDSKINYDDATIACGGKLYPVHRLVLSVCSDYFAAMFAATSAVGRHPIIVLKDIPSDIFEVLLKFIYIGEVNIERSKFSALVDAARCLKVRSLASYKYDANSENPDKSHDVSPKPAEKRKVVSEEASADEQKSPKVTCQRSRQLTGANDKQLVKQEDSTEPQQPPSQVSSMKINASLKLCSVRLSPVELYTPNEEENDKKCPNKSMPSKKYGSKTGALYFTIQRARYKARCNDRESLLSHIAQEHPESTSVNIPSTSSTLFSDCPAVPAEMSDASLNPISFGGANINSKVRSDNDSCISFVPETSPVNDPDSAGNPSVDMNDSHPFSNVQLKVIKPSLMDMVDVIDDPTYEKRVSVETYLSVDNPENPFIMKTADRKSKANANAEVLGGAANLQGSVGSETNCDFQTPTEAFDENEVSEIDNQNSHDINAVEIECLQNTTDLHEQQVFETNGLKSLVRETSEDDEAMDISLIDIDAFHPAIKENFSGVDALRMVEDCARDPLDISDLPSCSNSSLA
ncbi:hypothetical protein HAZT_HAZT004266 [Hyalella azteca]|uniref:BTB domain-containing protein n=1 Tax=Hyalella azteca TaxID=294128 RepID=A0A6A0GSE3_HYAAZ|nr:hypothetical protein HAZT_HAZT004266 [Hyalella azteca]